ncbi:uncharacterized protein LOC114242214 [Bombyx mandarina]|uniref:Uncharacterized protein LOC114242214 n=1 Tax=Bombyx mandarina TaxID=7092 RepID=A0A6J2JJA8_BOMMA|nr:uncharacterized protein LOC114242214 [Bombyx mandarina]
MRRMNVKIAKILNQKSSQIPNFNNNDDDPSKITRRFDELRKKAIKGIDTGKNYLRLEYFSDDNITEISIEKNKTLALMEHYIYETRYKLPYAQLLRKKYRDNIKYKIGFCFALLRQLKQQQMMIYTTLVNQYLRTTTLHFHIKMYEKVVRLDIDIKDVILLVRRYERARKLALNPNYYDDS